MSTVDKLNTILETKANIAEAIGNKGVEVPASTPFSGYAGMISQISTGLDSEQVQDMINISVNELDNKTLKTGGEINLYLYVDAINGSDDNNGEYETPKATVAGVFKELKGNTGDAYYSQVGITFIGTELPSDVYEISIPVGVRECFLYFNQGYPSENQTLIQPLNIGAHNTLITIYDCIFDGTKFPTKDFVRGDGIRECTFDRCTFKFGPNAQYNRLGCGANNIISKYYECVFDCTARSVTDNNTLIGVYSNTLLNNSTINLSTGISKRSLFACSHFNGFFTITGTVNITNIPTLTESICSNKIYSIVSNGNTYTLPKTLIELFNVPIITDLLNNKLIVDNSSKNQKFIDLRDGPNIIEPNKVLVGSGDGTKLEWKTIQDEPDYVIKNIMSTLNAADGTAADRYYYVFDKVDENLFYIVDKPGQTFHTYSSVYSDYIKSTANFTDSYLTSLKYFFKIGNKFLFVYGIGEYITLRISDVLNGHFNWARVSPDISPGGSTGHTTVDINTNIGIAVTSTNAIHLCVDPINSINTWIANTGLTTGNYSVGVGGEHAYAVRYNSNQMYKFDKLNNRTLITLPGAVYHVKANSKACIVHGPNKCYISFDNANSWTQIILPADSYLSSPDHLKLSNNIIMISDSVQRKGQFYYSKDYGITWNSINRTYDGKKWGNLSTSTNESDVFGYYTQTQYGSNFFITHDVIIFK